MNKKENSSVVKKVSSLATAAAMGMSAGTTTFANERINEDIANNQELNAQIVNVGSAIDSLYQYQMYYLELTQKKLQDFYENTDTKGIIKNAFPIAYNIAYSDLNTQIISYGSDVHSYIANNEDLIAEIKKNNEMLLALKIKREGNARDTDYGVISDPKDPKGFRLQTEEDRELINEYTNLLGHSYIVSDSLLNVLVSFQNNEVDSNDYDQALNDIYQNQIAYLIDTQKKLQDFFENTDINNVIKNGYTLAHQMAYTDLNTQVINYGVGAYSYISNNEDLFAEINNNNNLISNLKIKYSGSARDTDYGVIIDPSSPAGIRVKTEEDQILINDYTQRLGVPYLLSPVVIHCLDNIRDLQHTNKINK